MHYISFEFDKVCFFIKFDGILSLQTCRPHAVALPSRILSVGRFSAPVYNQQTHKLSDDAGNGDLGRIAEPHDDT